MKKIKELIVRYLIYRNAMDTLYWKGKLDAFNKLKPFCCFKSLMWDNENSKNWNMCTISKKGMECTFKNCPYMEEENDGTNDP